MYSYTQSVDLILHSEYDMHAVDGVKGLHLFYISKNIHTLTILYHHLHSRAYTFSTFTLLRNIKKCAHIILLKDYYYGTNTNIQRHVKSKIHIGTTPLTKKDTVSFFLSTSVTNGH